ncbi:hypothetical protein ABFS83_14G189100 [Erythranthe nasuta]
MAGRPIFLGFNRTPYKRSFYLLLSKNNQVINDWTKPRNHPSHAFWHSTLPSPFRAYPKENPVLLGREYLNWLFVVQEFLFGQFIPSIHSVF